MINGISTIQNLYDEYRLAATKVMNEIFQGYE